jgi:hypothetical protein
MMKIWAMAGHILVRIGCFYTKLPINEPLRATLSSASEWWIRHDRKSRQPMNLK